MSVFASKPAASAEKLRGGYYTPEPVARRLCDWVAEAGPRLLEPSCGDGALMRFLPPAADVTGVELVAEEAAKARGVAPGATVEEGDFFAWLGDDDLGRWDGVVGNPPFIRFQHWVEPTRSLAFDVMRSVGMRPTKLTNAWVPFVVAGSLCVREGGRLALVVPAELMQVTYAAELRGFLVDAFSELTVVTFRQLLFDGVLQEVVLLLGVRGRGPARIRVSQLDDAAGLPDLAQLARLPHAPALRHDHEKWTKYFLEPEGIAALRSASAADGVVRLGTLADVDVGVVTGRNRFFVLRPSAVASRRLDAHVTPLVGKSAQVRGIRFTQDDLDGLVAGDAACRLLAATSEVELDDDSALGDYVKAGEAEAVHTGYKCAIRRRWWVVPSVWTPDAFLLRQIHHHPRIVVNQTGATSTDTIHRVRMLNGTPPIALALAAVNSMTFAFAEVLGRSYGGGVLELEPREAEALPLPDPALVPQELTAEVDAALREGDPLAALELVDRVVLIDRLGFDERAVADLRAAWRTLRDRRLSRN